MSLEQDPLESLCALWAQKRYISERIELFRQLAAQYRRRIVPAGEPRPIHGLFAMVCDFVMESSDTFVQRMLGIGLAREGDTMVIIPHRLCHALQLSKDYILKVNCPHYIV